MELKSTSKLIINDNNYYNNNYYDKSVYDVCESDKQSVKQNSGFILKTIENYLNIRRRKFCCRYFIKNSTFILLLFIIGFPSVSSKASGSRAFHPIIGSMGRLTIIRVGSDTPSILRHNPSDLNVAWAQLTNIIDVLVSVDIPKEAEIDNYVDMKCNWKIHGGKSLYTVKWYKDGHEFFRFAPTNDHQTQTFPQTGVKLNITHSREDSIRLINLTLDSAGQYKCEVSTDAPAFETSTGTGNLTVISLPKRNPEITGLSTQYAVGENMTANCTVWPSVPRATIRWTINDQPVPAKNTIKYPSNSRGSFGNNLTTLGLRLEAEARHFSGSNSGTVKIRCLTEIGSRHIEAVKNVQITHVNNQRLSAGDPRNNINSVANSIRLDLISIGMVVFTMT